MLNNKFVNKAEIWLVGIKITRKSFPNITYTFKLKEAGNVTFQQLLNINYVFTIFLSCYSLLSIPLPKGCVKLQLIPLYLET